MKFKAGDKVWHKSLDGSRTVKGVVMCQHGESLPGPFMVMPGNDYIVELEGVESLAWFGYLRSAHEWQLSPRDEDGRQVGEWAHGETTWRPKREVIDFNWVDCPYPGSKKEKQI
jgi:hypothetical protein